MIDLHCHILPNIDDGPKSIAMSLEMARVALDDGIKTIVATPHGRKSWEVGVVYSVDIVHQRLASLQDALAEANLPLEVIAGTELFYEVDLPTRLKAGELLPYGSTRTVLMEMPNDIVRSALEQGLFAMQLAGYQVVLAHPERIKIVQADPNILVPLIERGMLMQLTADALTNRQGDAMRRLAELLLTHNMIHVLASDGHGSHLQRMPLISDARRLAADLVGEATATALVQDTPAAILADTPVQLAPPQPVRRGRWWR